MLIGTTSDEGSLFVAARTSPSQFEAAIRAQFGPFAGKVLAVYPHAKVLDAYFAWLRSHEKPAR